LKREGIIAFFSKQRTILVLYVLLATALSLSNFNKGQTKVFSGDTKYTFYNNYVIFKHSFFHLQQGKDLYVLFPETHWDLYKYSPSFSVAMAVFAYLPDWLGLLLWNLVNVLILFYGVRYFIKGPPHTIFMLWFIFNELFTSVLNSQSNPMIAGMLVAAFTFFEKDKVHWAALLIVSTFYIKVFGILAALLFLFYPNKWRFILWSAIWTVAIGLLPLMFTSTDGLVFQYQNWLRLLSEDHSGSIGYSFMGVLQTWFGLQSGKDVLVIAGLIITMLPFVFVHKFKDLQYRINWFASLLIWLVIFNHKAESPTFIIAFTGIALWLFTTSINKTVLVLAVLAFVFTSLAPTDLFPASIRHSFFEPYAIKAVPCILIWLYLNFQLIKSGLNKSHKIFGIEK
jgi:hypothetical protein